MAVVTLWADDEPVPHVLTLSVGIIFAFVVRLLWTMLRRKRR